MMHGVNYHDCNPNTNGELLLWKHISSYCESAIFVGAKEDESYIAHNPDCIYHLFEPNPQFYDQLVSSLGNNPNVRINNVAVSSKKGAGFYYERSESFVNRYDEDPVMELAFNTILDYVNNNGIEKVDFIKIDTEGYELEVLKGCGDLLKNVKHIQFEGGSTYTDAGFKQSDVYDILKPFGFEFYIIGVNGLYSQPTPEEHEMYSNHFATRCPDEVVDIIIQQNTTE